MQETFRQERSGYPPKSFDNTDGRSPGPGLLLGLKVQETDLRYHEMDML